MPVGIETYSAAGKVLFSSDIFTWQLRRTGSGTSVPATAGNTLVGTIKIPIDITTLNYPVFGFQCEEYVGFLGTESGTNYPCFACSANGEAYNYFVFDWANSIPNLGYGFETFNSAGQRTYSSAQRALLPLDVITSGDVTFTGKSLCAVVPSWSGHEVWPATGTCFDNEPAEPWEDGEFCSNLQIAVDSKIYGARTINSNQTVEIGEISFDDVNINISSAQWTAHDDYQVLVPFFVADVTGITIGSTFY